jgi:hypothetical protein
MEVAMRASIRVSMSMAREKAMTLMIIGCEMNWGLRELKSRETFSVQMHKRRSAEVDI